MTRRGSLLWPLALALVFSVRPATVSAQATIDLGSHGTGPFTLAVDGDDDDEDGHVDATQELAVPTDDTLRLSIGGAGRATVSVSAGLRLLREGAPLPSPVEVRLPADLAVQGTRASRAANDASVRVELDGQTTRVLGTVIGLAFLAADNTPLQTTQHALGFSRHVTNDATLPRRFDWGRQSRDRDNVRVELWDPGAEDEVRAELVSVGPDDQVRARLSIPMRRPRPGAPHRSTWLRLVTDRTDAEAPGVGDRVLRAALRDRIEVRYGARAGARQSARIGRPGDEDHGRAVRRATARVRVLRMTPGGRPVLGRTDADARRLGRDQVAIANEVWGQCFVSFGRPEDADVAVVDPPPPSLVSISDADGLPARGGGIIRLRVEGRAMRPVTTHRGALPVDTALDVAESITALGMVARVIENSRTEFGAGRSADVLVRSRRGELVTLTLEPGFGLGTDAQQRVAIGHVDLSDGLQEFNNMNASAGTLEERSLIHARADTDPSTIDILVVNAFTGGTRQGEAFIEADSGAVINALFLDRNGIRQQRAAWTQSHEAGHILLDQPFHPDNVGADRPWLLMDADSSLPMVTGPKRLSDEECERMRAHSGVGTVPALLRRDEVRATPPASVDGPYDLGYPRPTR